MDETLVEDPVSPKHLPLALALALLVTGCLGLPGSDDPPGEQADDRRPWVAVDGIPSVVHHRDCDPGILFDLQLSVAQAPYLENVQVTLTSGQAVETVTVDRLQEDTLVHRKAMLQIDSICDPPQDRRITVNATADGAAPNAGSVPLIVHGTDLRLVDAASDRFTCDEVTFGFEVENTGAVDLTNLSADATLWDPETHTYLGPRWHGNLGDVTMEQVASANGTIAFDRCPPQESLGLILQFHHADGEPIARSYQLHLTRT